MLMSFANKNVEAKRKPAGQNSFVAQLSASEHQMDLFFINDLKDQKFKVGMIMIDVFDKFMHVVPLGMIECLRKTVKKPKSLYADDEGALSKESIQTYLKEQNIEHHRTRAHANFSERAIKTFKDMLYKRVEADGRKGKSNIQWTDYVREILLTYDNQMKPSATKTHVKRGRETQ